MPSSTVTTPSAPTSVIASASISPISVSLLAEIAPTWAICSFFLLSTFFAIDCSSATTAATAVSMPLRRLFGSTPEVR